MVISHRYRFIFVHIQRTGGHSIEKALSKFVSQKDIDKINHIFGHMHVVPRNIEKYFSYDIWKQYFKFAFVRNPWDRAVSFYHYFKQNKRHRITHPTFAKTVDTMDFSHWIKRTNLVPPQFCWVIPDGSNFIVDFVGRFENLQEDFDKICDRVCIPSVKLETIMKTKHKHYSMYYTDDTRAIASEKFKKDIKLFGYKFE